MKIKINKKYKPLVLNFHSSLYLDKEEPKVIKNLLKNNNLLTAIKRLRGINYNLFNAFLKNSGISSNIHNKLLKKKKWFLIDAFNNYLKKYKINIGKNTYLERKNNIEQLQNINSYRGQRHTFNLPTRGQRTSSNAKTRKRFKII